MTVSVPIQADPSNTISAIDAIRVAMRGIGDEGRALADVDFTKVMGTSDLLRDLEKAKQNLEDLLLVGRGQTAAAARQVFGPGGARISEAAFEDMQREAARRFPNEAERARFIRTVGKTALRGTAFDPGNYSGEQYGPPEPPEQYGPPPPPQPGPPPPPPPPPPPEPPAPPGELGGKLGGALKSGLMGGVGFFLAQAGLQSIAGTASAAMAGGAAQNDAADHLLRRVGDLDYAFDDLRKRAEFLSQGMQINSIDLLRYTNAFVQASGMTTTASMFSTRMAVGLAQSFGADPGSMVHAMGHSFPLGMEPGRFAEMVGESAVRGSMGGRVEEVMGAISHWIETASRVSATRADVDSSAKGFTDLYTEMNHSKIPAFSGGNGVGVIDQLNGAITGGGGGIAGQVEMMLALRSAGITNPTDVAWQLAGGAFATLPGGKGTNLSAIIADLHRRYPDRKQFGIAGQNLTGINMRTFAALSDLGSQEIDYDHLDKVLAPFGGITGVNPTSIKDLVKVDSAKSFAELNEAANQYLAPGSGYKLSPAQSKAIADAQIKNDTEGLRSALIDGLGRAGMPETDASRSVEAEKALQEQMAEMGRVLVNTMTPLNQHLADLLSNASPLFEWAANALRPDAPMDPTDGALSYGSELVGIRSKVPHWVSTGLQPITIGPGTGELSAFGQVESGMGTDPNAKGNVFQLKGGNFTKNLRILAQSNPKVAAAIDGKSDAEIEAMMSTDPSMFWLQQLAAGYQLSQVKRVATHHDKLGEYAVWHFWKEGNNIMDAPSDTPMSTLLSPEQYAANPYLQGMTAGQWRAKFRGKGLDGAEPPGFYGPPVPASAPAGAGGTVHHQVSGHTTIVLQDNRGKTLATHSVPLKPSGDPVPHGVAHLTNHTPPGYWNGAMKGDVRAAPGVDKSSVHGLGNYSHFTSPEVELAHPIQSRFNSA